MIEQQSNKLVLTFPTEDSATTFAVFLATLLQSNSQGPEISEPLSGSLSQASPEPGRSRHTVLTDERLEALSRQRESGQTRQQRILKAQVTLRDGTLPFRQLESAPSPTGQPSPRQRAQQLGGFADGAPKEP